eukprot:CAMPEP_0175065444 /NCGR_PEP_ID=MMETSP0052_2-20121109/15926_1 /TAXON_ID=51329 ORGANISM="Polytomella parva, Strain SAG 63-3" /NCGR_SAMPLE_ID=MMETSP0052_2 /ASSEMBLY_ACC=CAM_ASM_000194 /LENGTH=132 /DNA_ID=CAMNT_0016331975 /DNA_START=134 /DNA_END=528 /DNA_ORIENTATION=+
MSNASNINANGSMNTDPNLNNSNSNSSNNNNTNGGSFNGVGNGKTGVCPPHPSLPSNSHLIAPSNSTLTLPSPSGFGTSALPPVKKPRVELSLLDHARAICAMLKIGNASEVVEDKNQDLADSARWFIKGFA